MSKQELLAKIKEKLSPQATILEKSPSRVFITVSNAEAKELAHYFFIDLSSRFSIASGVDTRLGIELLYHFAFDQVGLVITIKTMVPKPELEMESFSSFMPAAEWIEREIHEMLGVKFIGHPKLETLLLPDDWPEGVYPLRKNSFDSEVENEEREN